MVGFLRMLDEDIADDVIRDLRNLWVYGSMDVSENMPVPEEKVFFVEIGMTESSRPLEEYQEIAGHTRAVDLVFELADNASPIGEAELFSLHRALMSAVPGEAEEPAGGWKCAPNGTFVHHGGEMTYYEFAAPDDVPCLMEKWIALINRLCDTTHSLSAAVSAYASLHMALVLIHPFCDGNGRMARLVSNIPVLRAGLPPILIRREQRDEYIHLLSAYKLAQGELDDGACLLPDNAQLHAFMRFCRCAMGVSMARIATAVTRQKRRIHRNADGRCGQPAWVGGEVPG